MDGDTLKTLVSVLSACVAVFSATLAYKTRQQTRADLFISTRDSLILLMTENDLRSSNLRLQCLFAQGQLSKVTADEQKEEVEAYLNTIATIEKAAASLDQREYSAKEFESVKYSEGTLAAIRQLARGEQVILKELGSADYDHLFKRIDGYVAEHKKTAA